MLYMLSCCATEHPSIQHLILLPCLLLLRHRLLHLHDFVTRPTDCSPIRQLTGKPQQPLTMASCDLR